MPATALALALALACAGCAGQSADEGQAADASEFPAAGPWAEDFAVAVSKASAYERSVLDDGEVSAAEIADAQHRTRACVRDGGYDYRVAEDGTGEAKRLDGTVPSGIEELNAILMQCESKFDVSITTLYNEVRRNPEKQDEARITVGCLRKSGLVGADYSERKWRAENDSGRFSFNEYDPAAVQCRLDPLGLWRKQ